MMVWTPTPSKEKWKMLNMKWMTDHDDRLVATWTHSDPAATTGGRGETIMLKMKWRFRNDGQLYFEKAYPIIVRDGDGGSVVCTRTGREQHGASR